MLSMTVDNLINLLKPRQQEVLGGRFGLENGEKKTLAELGAQYGITRERVRQIEEEALEELRGHAEKETVLQRKVLDPILRHLKNHGGVRRDEVLQEDLKKVLRDNELHHGHLRFLATTVGKPLFYEDDDHHLFWYSDPDALLRVQKFLARLEKIIENRREELLTRSNFEEYLAQVAKQHKVSMDIGRNYLTISKKFRENPFGDIGLHHWEEINPKTMRSKAYLVLRRHGKPLHFTEVAHHINKSKFGENEAHPQTVHNELIKDPRVVLVGRGIYALGENGFVPGTCKDVLVQIVDDKGPMELEEILEEMKKQRMLKESTILLNLQNRRNFKRLDDGRYDVV